MIAGIFHEVRVDNQAVWYSWGMVNLTCKECGKSFQVTQGRFNRWKSKYCSRTCSNRANAIKGSTHWNYKGSMTYTAIHDWLHDNHPNPTSCVHCGVIGRKNKGDKWSIQWALKKGKKYDRVLDNFMGLCAPCHIKYDETSIALKPVWNKGRSWTEAEKAKISEGTRLGMAKLK